jgi:hypothetical protein
MAVIVLILCAWVAVATVGALLIGAFIRFGTSDVRPLGPIEEEMAPSSTGGAAAVRAA